MQIYEIEQGELPKEFTSAWQCAGKHIHKMGQEGVQWLRANLNPPIAEHLSFRLGNQLFFVYVDVNVLPFVGKRKDLFINVAREATATPCVLKMQSRRGAFDPVNSGWGFIDAVTGRTVNPSNMVSNELIEISDWELHDFAIQIVRSHLEKEGKNVFSAQSSLHIDPSIWFEDNNSPFWVVVRVGRYPMKEADIPANLQNIKQSCSRMSRVGFFASVTVANANDPFDPSGENAMPLYRGHGMIVRFEGLESV
ncbi:MAG: hypothetical protein PHH59_08360 [Methylovulum sp.]|uniref:hypothetical protein n=1 Tax=Methylovulum sp. TaxID=1916980 RepID=UPI002636A782|nr:hypothetical protein [Methylovulum sp.]MDD2724015.1 hypothetical protein [Methylovulum sp.]